MKRNKINGIIFAGALAGLILLLPSCGAKKDVLNESMTVADLKAGDGCLSLILVNQAFEEDGTKTEALLYPVTNESEFEFDSLCVTVAEKAISKGDVTEGEEGLVISFTGLEKPEEGFYKILINQKNGKDKAYTYAIVNGGMFMLSPATVSEAVKELTPEEKASLVVGYFGGTPVAGAAGATAEIKRLGIPAICLADGPQGVRLSQNTVLYTSGAVTASSWDRAIAEKIGNDIGDDCVKTGVDVILGPGMNVQRVALGGRNFEYFSEDPFLTGKTASSYTKGVQETGTGVSLKHFACNNQESSRGSVSVIATERAIRDIYLRAFGYAVREQNPRTVMSSYNRINGKYTSVYKPLLSVLRDEFGFKGLVMSDWGSGGSVNDKIEAGNDLTEPGTKEQYDTVLSTLKKNRLREEALDKAVQNILSVVAVSNSFTRLYDSSAAQTGEVLKDEHHKDAVDAAKNGIVLLKNEGGALPFGAKDGKIALFGEGAEDTVFGGYGSGSVNASNRISFKEGFVNAGYAVETFSVSVPKTSISDAAEGCGLAAIIIKRTSSEGADIDPSAGGFKLTNEEASLISGVSEAFHEKNKKVLVLFNTGNPVEVESWREKVDAIIWTGFAGEGIGEATASIVSGETNPSGKLAITWPTSFESLPYAKTFPGNASTEYYNDDIYVGYRYFTTFDIPVSFEFGFGLSYTSFAYSDFKAEKQDDGTYNLTVTVKNTGKAAGREVVEFYVSKPEAQGVNQPACELCGYGKTSLLRPGKSEKITVNVTAYELETFVTADMSFEVLPGSYKFTCGSSCLSRELEADVQITEAQFEKRAVSETIGTSDYIDVIKPGYNPSENVIRESIAVGAKVTSGGNESDSYLPGNVVDGNLTTRWSAAGVKDKWITVDLGKITDVSDVRVRWESNSSGHYTLALSDDGQNFETAAEVTTDDTLDMTTCVGKKTRYIKIYTKDASDWYSIYEIDVYD